MKNLYHNFRKDDVPALSAQASYFLLLSVFPFLIAVISILSLSSNTSIQTAFEELLQDFFIPGVYNVVSDALNTALISGNNLFISISGFVLTMWTLTRSATHMIKGINKAYKVETRRTPINLYSVSLIFVVLLILIIVFTVTFLVFGKVIGRMFFAYLGAPDLFSDIWTFFRYFIAILCLFTAFCMVYIIMPNMQIKFLRALPGALFSTFAFILISTGLSYYVSNFGFYANAYGSIGAVILALIWLYWISNIIIIGAEINALLFRVQTVHTVTKMGRS